LFANYILQDDQVLFSIFPELKIQYHLMGTDDPDCPYEYNFYFKDDPSPQAVCGIDHWNPYTMSVSPDRNWLFLSGNIYTCDSTYLINLNNFTIKELGDSIVWILGWTPDNLGLLAVTYSDVGRKIEDELDECGRLEGEEYSRGYIEYLSEFDSRVPSMLQFAVIDVSTGELNHIYQLPYDVQPMIKADNIHRIEGIGLGIRWQ
jgi:hypothetical protein